MPLEDLVELVGKPEVIHASAARLRSTYLRTVRLKASIDAINSCFPTARKDFIDSLYHSRAETLRR